MEANSTTIATMLFISGSVMCMTSCQPLAPSTKAASCRSCGIAIKREMKRNMYSPNPCQTSMVTRIGNAT
jgi:hypothetical protein